MPREISAIRRARIKLQLPLARTRYCNTKADDRSSLHMI